MEKRKEGREERAEGGMEGGNKIFKRGTRGQSATKKMFTARNMSTFQHATEEKQIYPTVADFLLVTMHKYKLYYVFYIC